MPPTRFAEKRLGLPEIKMKAKSLGLAPSQNMRKPELIHAIQTAEGYTPCFGKSNGQCAHTDCCFLLDCLECRL